MNPRSSTRRRRPRPGPSPAVLGTMPTVSRQCEPRTVRPSARVDRRPRRRSAGPSPPGTGRARSCRGAGTPPRPPRRRRRPRCGSTRSREETSVTCGAEGLVGAGELGPGHAGADDDQLRRQLGAGRRAAARSGSARRRARRRAAPGAGRRSRSAPRRRCELAVPGRDDRVRAGQPRRCRSTTSTPSAASRAATSADWPGPAPGPGRSAAARPPASRAVASDLGCPGPPSRVQRGHHARRWRSGSWTARSRSARTRRRGRPAR